MASIVKEAASTTSVTSTVQSSESELLFVSVAVIVSIYILSVLSSTGISKSRAIILTIPVSESIVKSPASTPPKV